MCLTPCSVATEFSILRATSVSSCAGDAPGRAAVTVTVGRSMSGKFWIFIALKAINPRIESRMKSRTAGIGFLIDQAETLMFMRLPGCSPSRRRRRLGRRVGRAHRCAVAVDHANEVAIAEKARARCNHPGARIEASEHLDPVADAAAGRDLRLGHARVFPHPIDIAETIAQLHRRLRQRQRRAAAELEL